MKHTGFGGLTNNSGQDGKYGVASFCSISVIDGQGLGSFGWVNGYEFSGWGDSISDQEGEGMECLAFAISSSRRRYDSKVLGIVGKDVFVRERRRSLLEVYLRVFRMEVRQIRLSWEGWVTSVCSHSSIRRFFCQFKGKFSCCNHLWVGVMDAPDSISSSVSPRSACLMDQARGLLLLKLSRAL